MLANYFVVASVTIKNNDNNWQHVVCRLDSGAMVSAAIGPAGTADEITLSLQDTLLPVQVATGEVLRCNAPDLVAERASMMAITVTAIN
jgi:hypothetical protein